MMKKISIALLATAIAWPLAAQETYENAKLMIPELNGTARYVGMGGAMEALGADISTMSTNPAGIGLFRKSWVGTSFSVVAQQEAANFPSGNKTTFSFDQMGFVYSNCDDEDSYVNIGFNYHKSRNFNYILSAANMLDNASQNKLTYVKALNEKLFYTKGGKMDMDDPQSSCNQLDDIYANNLNYDIVKDTWYIFPMDNYTLNRGHKGYISDFDFNLSGSINNRVYLGVTIGFHDVTYRHYGEYTEYKNGQRGVFVTDDRHIDGNGVDVKAGIIFRPIEDSALRFGLSAVTPTWYKLKSKNNTDVIIEDTERRAAYNDDEYEFKLYTPWKFSLSAGHTIGRMLALGLSYEYADYSTLDTRYITDSHYDYWRDTYTDDSESDIEMNRHTEHTLKGVSTLKAGLELKPAPELAIRLGYNYVSPMYEKEGFKDGMIASMGSYISSATDFTNWEDTHRITCGAGYSFDNFNLSVAYQYNVTNGQFWPFMNYEDNKNPDVNNIIAGPVKVTNKRHQVMMTLGYTF